MLLQVRRREWVRVAVGMVLVVVVLRLWTQATLGRSFWTGDWWVELAILPLGLVYLFFGTRDSVVVSEPGVSHEVLVERMQDLGYRAAGGEGPHQWFEARRFFWGGSELEVVLTGDGYVVIGERADVMRFRNLAMTRPQGDGIAE